jgi:hypothetical protein
MNDTVLTVVIIACAIAALAAFFLYNTYRGVHDSLTNAFVGDVYNFRYFQPLTGDYHRYLAKVVNIRKLSEKEISKLNWTSDYRSYDKNFKRSPTLVTCEMSNGDYRQFYAERSDMCKRTLAGNLIYNLGMAYMF